MKEGINSLGYWLHKYFSEYMVTVRNQSQNTRNSYRDTFKLMLPMVAKSVKKRIDELEISDITPEHLIVFLNHLESERKCTVTTRNQRLSAVYALANYIAGNSPEYIGWSSSVHSVPLKKRSMDDNNRGAAPLIYYLEKNEMNAMLDAPDRNTLQGCRDYALMLFLYNTGARASEVANVTISDLMLSNRKECYSFVKITGKGNKSRLCPLWERTVIVLKPFITGRSTNENLFINRYGNPITRYGIYEMIERHTKIASLVVPSILGKHISPHTIRHTAASHLLEAGVDINTIRAWLGHVSVETTNIYAEVNMRMKADAIRTCSIDNDHKKIKHWKSDKGIMDFLQSLK
jgi:site-specific recombinase XerD